MAKMTEKELKSLIRKAESGDPEACYQLYLYYRDSDTEGTTPDSRTAKWCRKAAELGNVYAMVEMGDIYYFGDFVEEDGNLEKALYWYTKAVEAGYAPALLDIADVYRSTYMEDPKEAFKFYKMAADEGVPVAYMHLWECYSRGYGVEASRQMALKCRQKAVQMGVDLDKWVSWEEEKLFGPIPDGEGDDEENDLDDVFSDMSFVWSPQERKIWARDEDYGKILKDEYSDKAGMFGDMAKSILETNPLFGAKELVGLSDAEILKEACSGNVAALAFAGMSILNGTMAGSVEQGEEFLIEASSKGHAVSAYKMGGTFLKRGEKEKAAIHFENASKAGHALASGTLASMYLSGNGVPLDVSKGFKLMKKAVAGEDPLSMFLMGLQYMQGENVKRNPKKAVELISRAADLGQHDALCLMGNFYIDGKWVTRNRKKGIYMLKRAAHMGSIDAMNTLGYYLLYETFVKRDPKMGRMLLERGVRENDEQSKWMLALVLFEKGSDISRGLALLQESCDQGFSAAIHTKGRMALEGKFVKKDLKKAEKLLRESFGIRHKVSETVLGCAYLRGLYGPDKVKEGFLLVNEAALDGSATATALLSKCYEKGVGVEKDAVKAKNWETALKKKGFTVEDVLVGTPEGFYEPDPKRFLSE